MHQTIKNIVVVGAGGAIGSAFIEVLLKRPGVEKIHAFSSQPLSFQDPKVIAYPFQYHEGKKTIEYYEAAQITQPIDLVCVTTGLLHNASLTPEKSIQEISEEKLMAAFYANTVIPTMAAQYFVPKLNKAHESLFFALSARVGSLSDNRLGGWYGYRASKAALNMMIKNIAIETKRKNDKAIVVGLHPGTVDSDLSKPFQSNLPQNQLFTPQQSAGYLLHVIEQLSPKESGNCFAWDGSLIEP